MESFKIPQIRLTDGRLFMSSLNRFYSAVDNIIINNKPGKSVVGFIFLLENQ